MIGDLEKNAFPAVFLFAKSKRGLGSTYVFNRLRGRKRRDISAPCEHLGVFRSAWDCADSAAENVSLFSTRQTDIWPLYFMPQDMPL